MPRPRSGSVWESRGKLYARVRIGKRRTAVALPWPPGEEAAAQERTDILVDLAAKLAGPEHATIADRIIRDAAVADGKRLAAIRATVDRLAAGKLAALSTPLPGSTFGAIAEAWTSGDLAKRYPDHVAKKKSAKHDEQQLAIHVLPLVKDIPLRAFTREHGNQVLAAIAPGLSKATRRHVAQLVHRVLALAVEPLGIISAHPLPRGWMPKVRRADQKPQAMPYPDEIDKTVAAANAADLAVRLFVGVMAREGMRHEEGARLDWSDVDLDRGTLRLEENKTNDPRRWTMNAGTWRALKRWHDLQGDPKGTRPLFVAPSGRRLRVSCAELRAAYLAAGVDRAELHAGGKTTSPSGFHGLRSLFVTEHLANDKTEKWITLRTGHQTSDQLRGYDSAVAMFREAGVPPSGPLDVLLGLTAEPATDAAPATDTVVDDDQVEAAEAPGLGSGLGSASTVEETLSAAMTEGSGAWIRTTIRRFKVSCPALERRRKRREL